MDGEQGGLWQLVVGALSRVTEWVTISLLWLLGCLPIITIGTSCAAAYYTAVKAVRKYRGGIWSCYWHSFRQNIRDGILCTLPLLVFFGLLLFYWLAMGGVTVLPAIYTALVWVLAILFLVLLVWLFPVLSRFSVKVGVIWTMAVVLTIRHPLRTLGACVCLLLVTVGILWSLPLIVLLPGLYCWGVSILLEPALRSMIDADQTDEDDDRWYLE